MLPQELGKQVLLQFAGASHNSWQSDYMFRINSARLQASFEWLVTLNYEWLHGANTDASNGCLLGGCLAELLEAYKRDLGNTNEGVLQTIVKGAAIREEVMVHDV